VEVEVEVWSHAVTEKGEHSLHVYIQPMTSRCGACSMPRRASWKTRRHCPTIGPMFESANVSLPFDTLSSWLSLIANAEFQSLQLRRMRTAD